MISRRQMIVGSVVAGVFTIPLVKALAAAVGQHNILRRIDVDAWLAQTTHRDCQDSVILTVPVKTLKLFGVRPTIVSERHRLGNGYEYFGLYTSLYDYKKLSPYDQHWLHARGDVTLRDFVQQIADNYYEVLPG